MSSHMEISSIRGLPELGMLEDSNNFLHQWNNLSSIGDASAFEDALQKHFLSNNPNFNNKTCMETSPTGSERPAKQLRNNSWNYNNSPQTSDTQQYANSCSNLLSFADSNYTNQLELVKPKSEMMCKKIDNNSTLANMSINQGNLVNQNHVFKAFQETKDIDTRPNKLSQAHDHIVAERRRREKLSQRFIALSALVPNLKKMDKASVLGEAIRYLKQMQEKVSVLEEEQKRKKTVQSVVIVKKSHLPNDVENSSSENETTFDETLPEIEARFCERSVLIRVHCVKSQGVIEKTISEIEKLHLKVINSSALTFGNFTLDITITAQMDVGFCMTVKELVRKLRSTFSSFM